MAFTIWPSTVRWSPTKVVVSCVLPHQGRVRRTYSNYGDSCFAAAGPKLWNSLPAELRQADILLLLLVWHAPLGVRSAKRRHQSPEWTILSHSYRLIQGEIV